MNIIGEIKVNVAPVKSIMKRLGVTAGGDIQRFHTANVRRRIQKYMPYRSGATIKQMIIHSPTDSPFIRVVGPHVRMLYYGKVMVDPQTGAAGFLTPNGWRSRRGVPKVRSDRDIDYTVTKNPQAGPFWDRRLKANEMSQMQADLQNYIKMRGGGG